MTTPSILSSLRPAHAVSFLVLTGSLVLMNQLVLAQPAIVATDPGYMETAVSPNASLIITFSAPMDTTATSVQLFDASGDTPVLLGSVSAWSADGLQVTNTPLSPFPSDTLIRWTASGEDASGHSLQGLTYGYFMTGSGGPTIVSSVPVNGATNVPPTAPLIITFSAPMDTADTAVQVLNYNSIPPTLVATSPSWSADGLRLTNTPAPSFGANSTNFWVVTGRDTQGLSLEGLASGMFMTGDGSGPPAPTILTVLPSNLSTNVPPGDPVVFGFSTAMNTSATTVRFQDSASPGTALPIAVAWSADKIWMTNTPSSAFPLDAMILWSAAGEDLAGTALAQSSGLFWTSDSGVGATNYPGVALLSRGERFEQTGTNLLESTGLEFVALATANPGSGCSFLNPLSGFTQWLGGAGASDALEFMDADADALSFATNYPPGDYTFELATTAAASPALLSLGDGPLPSAPRLTNWQDPPHVVLGQDCPLQWSCDPDGAPVDYVRVRVEQNGTVVFVTPLPDSAGALNATSNCIVVPADVFTNTGIADVSITAFSCTALDTNSIAGQALRAARHRTTSFELRIVDAATLRPVVLTTNLGGVCVGETFLNPIFATNGVRPLRFDLVGGTLPPGLQVAPEGEIAGFPTSAGTYDAVLRVTDLLGRSSTQSVRVVTVPLPPDGGQPHIENVRLGTGRKFQFDLASASDGDCTVERSSDLKHWSTLLTTNAGGSRFTLTLPLESQPAFFRVRAPALPAPNPLTVTPTLDTNCVALAQMDELGGTLALTNEAGYIFTLNVPVGALDRPETITMTDVQRMEGLPLSGGLRAAVELEPDGLMFNSPARLDITAPADLDPSTIMGFGSRPDGREFALQPAFNTNRTVSLYLWHFSLAGAGDGTAEDAQTQAQNAPDDPMAAMGQEVAAALQACKADPNCSINSPEEMAELIALHIKMADQVVLPKLKIAVSDDSVLDDAIGTWLKWLKDMALLGIYDGDLFGNGDPAGTELHTRVRRAGNLAAQAIRNGLAKNCERCMQHDVWRIYRVLEIARGAQLLGLDYDDSFWSCVRKCLVFEIKIESEIVSSDGEATFTTRTKGKAKLRPKTFEQNPDLATLDLTRLMLVFEGSGQWDVTMLGQSEPAKCHVVATPASGRVDIPWVKIHLYRKRETYVPGEGPVTSYDFDPDMTLLMKSGLSVMPKEKRQMVCPKTSPTSIPDIFGEFFNALHNHEVVTPSGAGTDVADGPVFKMTGFVPGGPEDVILSKPYFQTLDVTTENTLIDLRHTPRD